MKPASPSRRWMRPRRLVVGGLCLLASLAAGRLALWRPLGLAGSPPADGLVRLAGAVHVHTTYSDGGGTPQEVIDAAQSLGLDFLAITDHNNVDAKPLEGYHGHLL